MGPLRTDLCDLLGIEHPIVQDGMGPFRTARLAAAVSAAGGLGTVSIPGMTVAAEEGARLLRAEIEEVIASTDRPFAINVPVGRDARGEVLAMTETYISTTIALKRSDRRIARQLVAVTTSAGFPGEFTARIQAAGLIHMHKVGAVRQALKAEANGVDVIIASGYEMGGHTHESGVHTMVLAPQVIEQVKLPVIVSGGIYDGRGLAAALTMGAVGVAMGTRFIATLENEWSDAYKSKIVEADEWSDGIFPGVYGPLRGIRNQGVEQLLRMVAEGASEDVLTAWKDERMIAAQREGDVEFGLVPAGQCSAAIREVVSVRELLPSMAEQASGLIRRAAGLCRDASGKALL